MIFISKGKGVYGSALTEPFEVAAGTCFFLHPGVLHRYKPDPNIGWEEYWVGFNGFYVQQLMANGFFDSRDPFVALGSYLWDIHHSGKLLK
ncbi:AraC family ligand binding domain-containing protein [Pedobacter cryoconitis]|uniref:AraC family ligand binding domain-containing protein n=1 Tax=Pedobacter cryoconitis TaxID=188932 RepID=UPI0021D35D45|nr:AraC family ligand binding domain-containing protein [Pedobacter cryoconitis]